MRDPDGNALVKAWPLGMLMLNYLATKKYEKAFETCETLRNLVPLGSAQSWDMGIAYAYGLTERRDEALKIIDHWKNRDDGDRGCIATMFVGIGERDQAFDWLNMGYKERSPGMIWLKVEPLLDPLRDDPRFQDLLRRMNFPK